MIIVIEGGDQAGKKTQTELLAKTLKARKLKTKVFSFPDYTTPIGKKIKSYLNGKQKLVKRSRKTLSLFSVLVSFSILVGIF